MENLDVSSFGPVWFWAAVSVILLAGEVATGTFVLMFFAAAAGLTTAAVALTPMGLWGQLICFGATGLISLVAGKKVIRARMQSLAKSSFANDERHEFVADAALDAGAEGQLSYQGAPFTAINIGSVRIQSGDRVRIEGTQGIKIKVSKLG